MPHAALAYTDAEIDGFLQRRFACPVNMLVSGSVRSGQVNGTDGPVQAFSYGAEGCPALGFEGASFAVMVPGAASPRLVTPQPVPTSVSSVAVRGGYVVTTTLEYAPSDPRCCPSRQAAQRWVVSGNRLVRAP